MTVGQQSRHLNAILTNLGIMGGSPWDNPEPIREEIFSAERLEDHARSLAGAQPIAINPVRRQPLTSRLNENETALRYAFRTTITAAEAGKAITPAAEWLSDNFHIVERQIGEVRSDLPPGYYKQLPKLVSGPFTGYPRVLGLTWAYVAHTDSRFDAELLEGYVRAYQEVQPLTIGELWAVAITLRIVLIENLRRIAVLIEQSQRAREEADELATRLLDLSERDPKSVEKVLADQKVEPVTDAFAAQFVHMLRDQSPGVVPALTWLEERLAERATIVDVAIQMEQERQVGATVTVRNIITSMRAISEIDWLVLFERISLIDDVLVTGGLYPQMNFATRNLYRTAVEELARSSPMSEIEVAERAVSAAGEHDPGDGENTHRSDPGYYLFGAGRSDFEAEVGYQPPIRIWWRRLSRAMGLPGYGASIIIVAVLILLVPLLVLSDMGLGPAWLSVLATLGAVPALDAAVGVINASVTRTIHATFLPALELRGGVPPELRTLVAVPMMLTSRDSIIEQIEDLEIHHLSSLEGDVHFALLSDWADASSEIVDGDEELLRVATEGIAHLNSKYAAIAGGDRFVLLHRRRVWSDSEQSWIGWERKRGKLHELNRILRGATDTTFVTLDGRPPIAPTGVCYVITLDADTKLPRDTVRRLIGKMAHPLNEPRFDPRRGRVVEGYSILQPRVSASLPTKNQGTRFQGVFSSASGIDPYAAAVSDVYQDLFGEGSYAGKGIYHVDTFEASLAGRVPDSTMLSHDLFEGIFARAGLASDIEVVEEYPARYDVAMRRHHRWARGDWQLLPWILALRRSKRPIPMIGRAKMLDNLRRSLTAPTSVLALFAGWAAGPDAALVWTAFI
ncbi:MAG: glycosyl transferase, partial [Sphingomonas sp.]|nr:glycosyl transferase [Sphingomonas sp.]